MVSRFINHLTIFNSQLMFFKCLPDGCYSLAGKSFRLKTLPSIEELIKLIDAFPMFSCIGSIDKYDMHRIVLIGEEENVVYLEPHDKVVEEIAPDIWRDIQLPPRKV